MTSTAFYQTVDFKAVIYTSRWRSVFTIIAMKEKKPPRHLSMGICRPKAPWTLCKALWIFKLHPQLKVLQQIYHESSTDITNARMENISWSRFKWEPKMKSFKQTRSTIFVSNLNQFLPLLLSKIAAIQLIQLHFHTPCAELLEILTLSPTKCR